ncbi:hypothetical protein [Armatimonas sp.]|uniref:hypothetical protein n=1 Tax=Armatimonas sp. TaxID=1872638 RepID=UPI0037519C5B
MRNFQFKMFAAVCMTCAVSAPTLAFPPTPAIWLEVLKPSWNQEFVVYSHPGIYMKYVEVPLSCKFTFSYENGTPNTTINMDLSGKMLLDDLDTGYDIVTTFPNSYPILLDANGNGSLNPITLSHTFNINSTITHYVSASATAKIYGSSDTPVAELTPTYSGSGVPSPNVFRTPFIVKN